MLYLKDLAPAIEFYKKAFGATEFRRVSNPDGSVHVAEMAIGTALFRMHQETDRHRKMSPDTLSGTSVEIGLIVENPDEVMARAVAAGGEELSPMQDYEYSYRQGTLRDPFGHLWMIEKNAVV